MVGPGTAGPSRSGLPLGAHLLLAELGVGHAILPELPGWRRASRSSRSPVRLIPVDGLPPLTAGWAARQWNALSPLAIDFADTVIADLRTAGE